MMPPDFTCHIQNISVEVTTLSVNLILGNKMYLPENNSEQEITFNLDLVQN